MDDRHREGAILIRDHVIDYYLDKPRPDQEDLIEFLTKKLPISPAPNEDWAERYENDDSPHGWQVVSESDVRRGVEKAYRKLDE